MDELKIKNGESLVVDAPQGTQPINSNSTMIRRKVDDDNSCLFTSIALLNENNRSAASKLRKGIYNYISLEKTNKQ